MLVIRSAQLNVFKKKFGDNFLLKLEQHILLNHPDKVMEIGEELTQNWLVRSVESANQYGLETEKNITTYVDFCFQFGIDFENRLDCIDLINILTDSGLAENAKIYLAAKAAPQT